MTAHHNSGQAWQRVVATALIQFPFVVDEQRRIDIITTIIHDDHKSLNLAWDLRGRHTNWRCVHPAHNAR